MSHKAALHPKFFVVIVLRPFRNAFLGAGAVTVDLVFNMICRKHAAKAEPSALWATEGAYAVMAASNREMMRNQGDFYVAAPFAHIKAISSALGH